MPITDTISFDDFHATMSVSVEDYALTATAGIRQAPMPPATEIIGGDGCCQLMEGYGRRMD